MFVTIVQFPPVKAGKNAEFREWFEWSNKEYSEHEGFISRRLLKPHGGGNFNYVGLVEHESYETFTAMRTSPTQAEVWKRVEPLFEGEPKPAFYEVILG